MNSLNLTLAACARWWRTLLASRDTVPYAPQAEDPPEIAQVKDLLRAIDAGGVPINPRRVNVLARAIGLEVSARASMDETLERLRAAVERRRSARAASDLAP